MEFRYVSMSAKTVTESHKAATSWVSNQYYTPHLAFNKIANMLAYNKHGSFIGKNSIRFFN